METKLVYVKPECIVTYVRLNENLANVVPLSVKLTYKAEWEDDESPYLPENTQEIWTEW